MLNELLSLLEVEPENDKNSINFISWMCITLKIP